LGLDGVCITVADDFIYSFYLSTFIAPYPRVSSQRFTFTLTQFAISIAFDCLRANVVIGGGDLVRIATNTRGNATLPVEVECT
jgi:hypothetical protein